MWKSTILLIITIILVPLLAFLLDEPLSSIQLDILKDLTLVYLVSASACFIISSLSKNYSQVDKLWSLIPIVYVWMVCSKSGFEPRLILMSLMVTLWGLRLTYNFNRRGGYSIKFWTGEEDYRWAVLRAKPEFAKPWRWTLFNLLFISLYQMGLILLITLPSLKSIGSGPLSWSDYLISALILFLIIIETLADQQQWNFHKEKQRLRATGEPLPDKYKKGFIDYGLWGLTRHPNYSAEQAIWIMFYLFSVSATGIWLNWSVTGAILLVLLFRGSSNFSESVSGAKYPEYSGYQKRVNRFIPFI